MQQFSPARATHPPDVSTMVEKIDFTKSGATNEARAYAETITGSLPDNEYFGDLIKEKLHYYPTVTREPFAHNGRLTELLASGKLASDLGMPTINPEHDRFMICGSPAMLKDSCALLDQLGFSETRNGNMGHYVIERAFVEFR